MGAEVTKNSQLQQHNLKKLAIQVPQFYESPKHWKQILEANTKNTCDPEKAYRRRDAGHSVLNVLTSSTFCCAAAINLPEANTAQIPP